MSLHFPKISRIGILFKSKIFALNKYHPAKFFYHNFPLILKYKNVSPTLKNQITRDKKKLIRYHSRNMQNHKQ